MKPEVEAIDLYFADVSASPAAFVGPQSKSAIGAAKGKSGEKSVTIPNNRMSYVDVFEKFDLAKDDPRGIRIPFATREEAKFYRMRMHQARAIDRRENTEMYEQGHPLYGQSTYDTLQIRIREGEDGSWFVYVEPKDKYIGEVERLSEIEAEDEIDAS